MSVDFTWIEPSVLAIGRFPSYPDFQEISTSFRVLINVTEEAYTVPPDENHFAEVLYIPVHDMSVPSWPQLFQALRYLASYQKMQLPVFLHCYAGLGRSGFFAALFCMMQGLPAKQAIEKVRALREGAIETDEQLIRLYEMEPVIPAILDTPEQTWFEATHLISLLRKNCPWDRVQTYETLIHTIMDESFEVVEAIRKHDIASLEEEIGDMMIQPLLISEIAKENNSFTLPSSLEKMMQKLVRRHPHVFSQTKTLSPDGVVDQWNGIKLGEYKQNEPGILGDIMSISLEASEYGFDWETASDILHKIQEEVQELEETVRTGNKRRIEEELGDLFLVVLNMARFLKINPIKSLERGRRKFESRFRYVQKLLHEQKIDPKSLSSAQLDDYWKQAKKILSV